MSKYSAKKITYNGEKFDSKKELRRYLELKLLERTGDIWDLQRQVRFSLIPPQRDRNGKVLERQCDYIADFVYYERTKDGVQLTVEDTKGYRTKDYIIKRKLMLSVHGIRIKET